MSMGCGASRPPSRYWPDGPRRHARRSPKGRPRCRQQPWSETVAPGSRPSRSCRPQDPFTLRAMGGGQRFGREFPGQCGLAHGVEKDGNELGGPAADKRRAVALLSVSQQATHHDEIASGPDGARMRGRTEITRGDRRRSPAQAGGERLRPRTVGGSRIRELRARRYRLSGFTGGDSPSAPRRSVRSPCRSNRRSARARQPRPRGTRPG